MFKEVPVPGLSKYFGHNLDSKLHYQYFVNDSDHNKTRGKEFTLEPELLKSVHFPMDESKLVNFAELRMNDFVFVTGVNSRYFGGLTHVLENIRSLFPSHKLLVYNLGLEREMIKEVSISSNKHPSKLLIKSQRVLCLFAWDGMM